MKNIVAILGFSALLAAHPAYAQSSSGGGQPSLNLGSTIQFLGDSFGANVSGNFYVIPGVPVNIVGNAHGTTTIDGIASTAGIQVGASIVGSDTQSATTIVSVSANSITISAAATDSASGVSYAVSQNVPIIGTGFVAGSEENSIMGWLTALSSGALDFDPSTGYGGNALGAYEVNIRTPGSGYSNISTWTASGVTGTLPGTLTATSVNGALVSGVVATQGNALSDQPTWTCQTGCGTGGAFETVLGGVGTFGASSDKTSDMLVRISDVLNTRPDWLIVEGGTNDINAGVAATTTIANMQAIAAAAEAAGSRVVMCKVAARRVWSGGLLSFAQYQETLNRVNRGIEMIGRQARAVRPNAPGVLICDPDKYWVDAADSSTPGRALVGMVRSSDNIHPSFNGGFWYAVAIREAMAPYLGSNVGQSYGQDDLYDATYNPTGNLIGTKGLMLGTSGVNTTACTGTVATGWTLQYIAHTATPTCTATEQVRTDAITGYEQLLSFTSITGGAAAEGYQLRIGTSPTNVAAGDQIYLYATIRISNYIQLNRIGINLTENAAGIGQNAYHLDAFVDTGSYLPPYTTVRNMPLQGILPCFVQGATDGGFCITLRTPPITLRPSTGGYSVSINTGFQADTGTAQGTLQIRNVGVKKTGT